MCPGRFVPLYGYERSINFPLGHRNILHVRRGVFSYRVPKLHISERPELIEKDAQGLWAYLRATDGVGLPHTMGTSMGTDWRLRDDELEPVAEIYQGDRNTYEEEGQPRAATRRRVRRWRRGTPALPEGTHLERSRRGLQDGVHRFERPLLHAHLLRQPAGARPRHQPRRHSGRLPAAAAPTARPTTSCSISHAGEVMQGGEMKASESPTFQIRVRGHRADPARRDHQEQPHRV